jgi:hypothetical protein
VYQLYANHSLNTFLTIYSKQPQILLKINSNIKPGET